MAKRAFDVAVGLVMCLVATPIIAVCALVAMVALRTTSPFFHQKRIGYRGEEVRFPKLRSLPQSMPAYALKTEMTFDHVPLAMRFIRKLHVDELPQLFLVVTGKLSLVGPRPKMPHGVEPVDYHYATTRTRVPQGCTGLWQISEHKGDLPGENPQYDLFYVKHQSVRLDLWILWRTLLHGLRLRPLVSLDDVPHWACKHDSIAACKYMAEKIVSLRSVDLVAGADVKDYAHDWLPTGYDRIAV